MEEWTQDSQEGLLLRFAFYAYKDEPKILYFSNLFVDEVCRNRGYGTRILASAEKVAGVIGATIIRLKVKKENPANKWYRKNGYVYATSEGEFDWLEKRLVKIEDVAINRTRSYQRRHILWRIGFVWRTIFRRYYERKLEREISYFNP